jgi:MFS family permease
MRADRRVLAAVFLVCFSNMLLEVIITRLFSATMYYHFTFLAVALALFGIAASGVYVFVAGERLAVDLRGEMAKATRRFAVAALLTLAYAMANPMDIIIVTGSNAVPSFTSRQAWQLMFLVGFSAIPFFYAGMVVSLALTFLRQDTNRVYAWDLAGAALAALTVGILLSVVGGPTAVLVAIAVALVGAALFETAGNARWVWAGAGAALVVLNLVSPIIRVPTTKGVKVEATRFEEWNAFSRVTVDDTNTIKIDASAATHVEDLRKLVPGMQQRELSALGHSTLVTPADEVLIIGPGGGRDVLHALASGAKHVTGVEVNPIIANRIMKERYREASGGLYLDPRVTVVVDDGRSFVRRSDKKYDVLQASLVDTWAATAAGAFALSENALYTVEAFDDYLDHLSERGILTMTRWHTGAGTETARLLLLAVAALGNRGIPASDARKHMFYASFNKNGLGTLIVKRTPITPDEQARLEARCKEQGFNVEISPTSTPTTPLARFIDGGPDSDLVASTREDLSPPTDDRPFFFYFKRAKDLLRPTGLMNDPGLWIMISLGSVLVLSGAFVIAPLVLHWRRRKPGTVTQGQGAVLGYFALVGLAFMVEIALLQRFTLFLGHPSYSLLVIVFSLLLATSIGAYLSSRFALPRLGRVMMIAGMALAGFAVLAGFVLPGVLHALIGASLPVRVVLTVLLVLPSGLLMGVMVPSIVRVLSAISSPLVPWGWGINGATSVIGTVIATVVAIYGGFKVTFLLGAVGYLAAGVLGQALAKRLVSQAAARTSDTADTASPTSPSP